MKLLKVMLLGLSIGLFACKSSNKETPESASDIKKNESAYIVETINKKFLVIPGRSIGQIALGEDTQDIGKKLGTPDAGDAAMGKSWSIWYSEDPITTRRNELAIYSSYKDSTATSKDVKQIRITSNQFKTEDGFGKGRTLKETRSKYPALNQVSTYLDEKKDTVLIFDSKLEGIGFEFSHGKSISLTVHQKNISISNTYLALHPEWKFIDNQ